MLRVEWLLRELIRLVPYHTRATGWWCIGICGWCSSVVYVIFGIVLAYFCHVPVFRFRYSSCRYSYLLICKYMGKASHFSTHMLMLCVIWFVNCALGHLNITMMTQLFYCSNCQLHQCHVPNTLFLLGVFYKLEIAITWFLPSARNTMRHHERGVGPECITVLVYFVFRA